MLDINNLSQNDKRKFIESFRKVYSAIEEVRGINAIKKDEYTDDLLYQLVTQVFQLENKLYPLSSLSEFEKKEALELFEQYVNEMEDMEDYVKAKEQFILLQEYYDGKDISNQEKYLLTILLNEVNKSSIVESDEEIKRKKKTAKIYTFTKKLND